MAFFHEVTTGENVENSVVRENCIRRVLNAANPAGETGRKKTRSNVNCIYGYNAASVDLQPGMTVAVPANYGAYGDVVPIAGPAQYGKFIGVVVDYIAIGKSGRIQIQGHVDVPATVGAVPASPGITADGSYGWTHVRLMDVNNDVFTLGCGVLNVGFDASRRSSFDSYYAPFEFVEYNHATGQLRIAPGGVNAGGTWIGLTDFSTVTIPQDSDGFIYLVGDDDVRFQTARRNSGVLLGIARYGSVVDFHISGPDVR